MQCECVFRSFAGCAHITTKTSSKQKTKQTYKKKKQSVGIRETPQFENDRISRSRTTRGRRQARTHI